MFDAYAVTSPKLTLRSAPTTRTVGLPAGIVAFVGVQFPTGCGGLVHARILRGAHQVWPTDLDEDIASDGRVIPFTERYPLLEAPHELRLEVWNEDDTYQHTVTFFFQVDESRVAPSAPAAPGLLERLRQLVGS